MQEVIEGKMKQQYLGVVPYSRESISSCNLGKSSLTGETRPGERKAFRKIRGCSSNVSQNISSSGLLFTPEVSNPRPLFLQCFFISKELHLGLS